MGGGDDDSLRPHGATGLRLGGAAAAAVATVIGARDARRQVQWAGVVAALLVGLAAAWLGAVRQARGTPLRPGPWLTAVLGPAARADAAPRTLGVLPDAPTWRGPGVDAAVSLVLAEHPGRWLVATVSALDAPPAPDVGVYLTLASPQVLLAGVSGLAAARTEPDLFAATRLGRTRYDGVLLALVPAGHPDAWRCYNDRALARQLARLQDGGLAALRVQAQGDWVPVALAAVRTLSDAVGPCWVVAQGDGDRVDLFAAGPAARIDRPFAGQGHGVTSTHRLWYDWPNTRPLQLFAPGAIRAGKPTAADFLRRLRAGE